MIFAMVAKSLTYLHLKWQEWFGISVLFLTLAIGKASAGTVIGCIMIFIAFHLFLVPNNSGKYLFSPYHFLAAAPFTLMFYSTIRDFQIRILCCLFVAILSAIPNYQLRNMPIKKSFWQKKWAIAVISLIIFSSLSSWFYFQEIHLSGDEPHYLIIAQSLIQDQDIDLANNFANRDYSWYMPVTIQPHVSIINHRQVPFHMPGLSIFLIPFILLYQAFFSFCPPQLYFRLAMGIINIVFAVTLFFQLKKIHDSIWLLPFWILAILLFPIGIHAIHLYPELPAATCLMLAFHFSKKHSPNFLLSGLFLSIIPWFHLKYISALVVMMFFLIKPLLQKPMFKKWLHFFCFPMISLFSLLLYSAINYGSWLPTAIFPKENYLDISLLHRLKTLLAYFFDQRDGLLCYAPFLFLFFFTLKTKFKHKTLLMSVFFSYILTHAWTTTRGAYSPAGRPLIFVAWIMIALIYQYYFSGQFSVFPNYAKLLTAFSFFVFFWILYHPLFVYQPVFAHTKEFGSALFLFLGNALLPLAGFLPSFLSPFNVYHAANYIWLIGWLGILIYYYRRKGKVVLPIENSKICRFGLWALFALLFSLFCLFPHLYPNQLKKYRLSQLEIMNSSGNVSFNSQTSQFTVKNGFTYDFYIRYPQTPQNISIHLPQAAETPWKLINGKNKISASANIPQTYSISSKQCFSFKMGNTQLIPISINLGQLEKHQYTSFSISSH
jgi:hypothetical protein